MAEVRLLSEDGKYKDKETGEEKSYTNFFVQCGNQRIPVEVKYFGTQEKPDKSYSSRKAVLRAFAEPVEKAPVNQ